METMRPLKTSVKIAVHPSNRTAEGYFPVCLLVVCKRLHCAVTLPVQPITKRSDLVADRRTGAAYISEHARYYQNREETNAFLNEMLSDALNIAKHLLSTVKHEVSAKLIAREIRKNVEYQSFKSVNPEKNYARDFYLCFDSYIEQKKAVKAFNSARTANVTKRCLMKFRNRLSANDLTFRLIKDFETWYIGSDHTLNGLATHLRYLKAVLNYALNNELIPLIPYPFRNYRIRTTKTIKRAVKPQIINLLKEYKPECRTEELAKDIFLFSFENAGINYNDIARLTTDNLADGRLQYARNKTGDRFSLRLSESSREIIEKYKGEKYLIPIVIQPELEGNELTRHITNRHSRISHHLRAIGRKLELPVPLTTYVARHTFATIAKQKNVPITAISELLGHESIATTQIYLSSLESEVLDGYLQEITAI